MALSKQINMDTKQVALVDVPVKIENEWSGSPFLNNWPEVIFDAELKELGEGYQIELIIPGVREEDLHIQAGSLFVDISAEKEEELHRSANSGLSDSTYQAFNRRFTLPESVDPEHIKATYRAGVLKIYIPKPFTTRWVTPLSS
jgi:HSP20 family molecular chaperone IbpA